MNQHTNNLERSGIDLVIRLYLRLKAARIMNNPSEDMHLLLSVNEDASDEEPAPLPVLILVDERLQPLLAEFVDGSPLSEIRNRDCPYVVRRERSVEDGYKKA